MDALSGWKPGGGSTMEIRRSRSGVVRCALRLACLACLSVSLAPLPASAKSILVFGPHEDDEIFLAAGIARAARARGDTVKMVLVTNGDINGVSTGLARQGNSVTASQAIGLAESDLIFLGYGDGSLGAMYRAGSGSQVFTSSAGVTSTYGNRGLGGMDYHRYRYGVSGPYSRNTLLGDIQDVLVTFRPDEIYAPSYFDDHDDHMATALLLVEGILALQRAGVSLPVKLFQGIIWAPGAPSQWPQVEATGFTPWLPHYKPSCCLDSATPFEWERLRHVMVPPEMQTSDRATSLKWRAIQSGFGSYAWYSSWARREEIFWVTDFGANLASSAQVSVSSENSSGGYGRAKAVDGTLHGSQVGGVHEWATSGQLAGAWIQLDWPAPVSVAQVNLYDRPSLSENVFAGTLSFSDGSTIAVASLPKGGQVSPVTFPPKQVAWVRFTVNRAEGSSAGLSEIEVLGKPAGATVNTPPHLLAGPGGASELSIPGGQSITVRVSAHDVDGDPLRYVWWTEAGTISGDGPTATLVAPNATVDGTVAYSVTVLDDAGGATTNFGFLKVTPGTGNGGGGSGETVAFSVTPASVTGGATALGTITVANPAPSGGQVIALASSNGAAAAVPASVTLPPGASATSFSVTTGTVTVATSVTLTATVGGVVRTAPLQVTPAAVASGANLAPGAKISVSSESTQFLQDGVKAVDGVVDGFDGASVGLPGDETKEWSTRGELSGAWIQLDWSPAVPIQRVVLYDRPNANDQVLAGTLHFSDGTSVSVGTLPNDAKAFFLDFPLRTASWMRFTVDQATGRNIGLAEIQVFGASTPPDTFSVAPASVLAGDPALGTITLGTAAPPGGRLVALTSSSLAAASVPASVLVAAGSTSATFPVSTGTVAATVAVTLSAALPGGMKTATLTVTPRPVAAGIAGLILTPASTIGGQNVVGTVTLTAAAAAGGFTCGLSTTDGAIAGVPASVVVPAGATSATFTVSTGAVTATRSVNIVASSAGKSANATLTIEPLALTALSVTPATVLGGASAQGSFTLNGVASGAVITLASMDPGTATVPASVVVAQGASGGAFPVMTFQVADDRLVTLSASAGASSRSTTLAVVSVGLASLTVSPTSVPGGSSCTGTVTLTGPAPSSGMVLSLASSSAAAIVPGSVVVEAGATTASFAVATSSVATRTVAVLTAAQGTTTRTASITINPPGPFRLELSSSAVPGGGIATGTVYLGGAAPAGGAVVSLASSNTATAQVPPSVSIPAGAAAAAFQVTTSQVTSTRSVTITATFGGVSGAASLTVQRLSVSSLGIAPSSVLGGGFATGTVTLGSAAAGNGFRVTLSSSAPSTAAVPASVTVAVGARSATFTISTGVPATATTTYITAAGGGSSRSASLTVTSEPVPLALTLVPSSVASGGASVGTVTLNGPAAAGGRVVTLSTNNTLAAKIPSFVTIPAGSLSATFQFTAGTVTSSTNVTVSAQAGKVTKRASCWVTP